MNEFKFSHRDSDLIDITDPVNFSEFAFCEIIKNQRDGRA